MGLLLLMILIPQETISSVKHIEGTTAGRPLLAYAQPVPPLLPPKPVYKPVYKSYDCVTTLKKAGILKCKDCSPTDRAIDIPIDKKTLDVGECGVLVTYEGGSHVLYACNEDGNYISKVEGAYPHGVGRTVSKDVVKGVKLVQ